ncbi:hypothetical protein [Colwellia sp. Arc7-D]|uniref:hypothetical protein n=1 Tax=Colwellia sp. Arc7-D TaxID=2161872 RepID=UPI000D3B1505|nr:hypothetical protein [Colwellia sp. Arc7-D]AWB56229.1 hypothetical protein DBO93_00695 [Colwellia sp. Arc7-D]
MVSLDKNIENYQSELILLCTIVESPREVLHAIYWGQYTAFMDGLPSRVPTKIVILNLSEVVTKRSIASYLEMDPPTKKTRKSHLISSFFGIDRNNRIQPKGAKKNKQLSKYDPIIEIIMLENKIFKSLKTLNKMLFNLTNDTLSVDRIHRKTLKNVGALGIENKRIQNETYKYSPFYYGMEEIEDSDYINILYHKYSLNLCMVNIISNSLENGILTSMLGRYARTHDAYSRFHSKFEPDYDPDLANCHESIRDYSFVCDWEFSGYDLLPPIITRSKHEIKANQSQIKSPEMYSNLNRKSNLINTTSLKNIEVRLTAKPDQRLSEVKPLFRLAVLGERRGEVKVIFDEYINLKSAMYLYAWSKIGEGEPQILADNKFLGELKAKALSFLLTGSKDYKNISKELKADTPYINKIDSVIYGRDGNGGLIGGKTESKDKNYFQKNILHLGGPVKLLNEVIRTKHSTICFRGNATKPLSTYAAGNYKFILIK